MSDLYGFVIWIESILNLGIILIECVRVLSHKSSRNLLGLVDLASVASDRQFVNPQGGNFRETLT